MTPSAVPYPAVAGHPALQCVSTTGCSAYQVRPVFAYGVARGQVVLVELDGPPLDPSVISAGDRSPRLQMGSISRSAQGRLTAVGRVSSSALDAPWTEVRKRPASAALRKSQSGRRGPCRCRRRHPELERRALSCCGWLPPLPAMWCSARPPLQEEAGLVDQHHRAAAPQHGPNIVHRRYPRRRTPSPRAMLRAPKPATDQVPMCQLLRYSTCSGVSSSMSVPSEATLSLAISLSMASAQRRPSSPELLRSWPCTPQPAPGWRSSCP